MEDLILTPAERRFSRKLMAELRHASCHLGLILNSCLLQWQWGMAGGKPGELAEFPPFPKDAFGYRQTKWIWEQLQKIDVWNWKLLERWGISGKKNLSNNLLDTTNQKVAILNSCLASYGPPVRVYLDDVIIQTAVLAKSFADLKELEWHRDKEWRFLCQTIQTLANRTATPNHLAYAENIYPHAKAYVLGVKALCDWEEEKE